MSNNIEAMADQKEEAIKIFKNLKETGSQVLILVNNLIQRVSSELEVENGIGLLDVKNQLMIQYLLNLAQLIILKTTGQAIEGNPSIERLIEDRIVLERCKPIEQKLKYNIEKYVKRSIIGSLDENDPSIYKAKPEDLLKGSDDDEDTEDEVNDKLEQKKNNGKYIPPKLTSVPYEEDERAADKQKKIYERARKHALRSSVIQELKEEYLDIPLEVKATNSVSQKEDKYQKLKKEYEEAYFTRLPTTKEEKRKAKLKFSMGQLNDEVTHFEDTSILHDGTTFHNKRKRISKKGKPKIKKRRKIH